MARKKMAETGTEGLSGVSLTDATELSRRDLLAVSRRHVAETIEAGVPAHTLARLIAELSKIDSEIRFIDATSEDESFAPVEDEAWDPSMI